MTLLGAAEIRELAEKLELRPSKGLGQNFVHDGNTCRKIVRTVEVSNEDVALEIGPGLGSLTIELLETAKQVIAIEIDSRLATQLPLTAALHTENAKNLTVIHDDAMRVTKLPATPTVLVANLPYNVSVPVLLHILEIFPTIQRGVVMVQAEVADRLAAQPGSKDYGAPSAKAAWWADLKLTGSVSRSIFWPVPNVDSKLVSFTRHQPLGTEVERRHTFTLIDAAFAQRRKMLRTALASAVGTPAQVEALMSRAGIDPTLRGESLSIKDFYAISRAQL